MPEGKLVIRFRVQQSGVGVQHIYVVAARRNVYAPDAGNFGAAGQIQELKTLLPPDLGKNAMV